MTRDIALEEYKRSIRKANEPRKYRIKNSLGIRDAFLFAQRNKWFNIGTVLREHTFQQIIREVNNRLAFEVMEGKDVWFPERMGSLEVRRTPRGVRVNNGKVESNYRIDWDKTLELWYNDEEARQNKTLVRDLSSKDRFFILYNRAGADFNNKCYTQFFPNRDIRRVLGQNIKQGIIEAYNYK